MESLGCFVYVELIIRLCKVNFEATSRIGRVDITASSSCENDLANRPDRSSNGQSDEPWSQVVVVDVGGGSAQVSSRLGPSQVPGSAALSVDFPEIPFLHAHMFAVSAFTGSSIIIDKFVTLSD